MTDLPPGYAALDESYRDLDYLEGSLLDATILPRSGSREEAAWLDKGEWLALAASVGVERLLFVNDEPLIAFYILRGEVSPQHQMDAFRKAWCMARPQRLFMALPEELRVYSLNRVPAASIEEWDQIDPLVIVQGASEVALKLQAYRRALLEAGRFPADDRFGKPDQRADRHLLRDLQEVRRSLIDAGLETRFAHALIGRSIFIRYLEDRAVLTPAFFEAVAGSDSARRALLDEPPSHVQALANHRRYDRVLRDMDFTNALFDTLAEHFNGDIFPSSAEERRAVQPSHIALLRNFLLGKGTSNQQRLLFWAYDFSIVPIELISNIYEEFYHEIEASPDTDEGDDKGTHYTPPALVEFMLGQVLTEESLISEPRVLDPACGSGIFLVEAFRRMVRFRVRQHGRSLAAVELREILRDRIVGVDVNPEAARIAAFSLCLALLHYQDPPDILAARLPNLLYQPDQPPDESYFHTIHHADAFAPTTTEVLTLEARLAGSKVFRDRTRVEELLRTPERLALSAGFDVIVGNPPWSEAKGRLPVLWADAHGKVAGDHSFPQLFIHRAISLARVGASIGMLVHSGVLFNQRATSRAFRAAWLREVRLRAIVNLVQVRRLFFGKAIAPFVFVHFEPGQPTGARFPYSTVRHTTAVERLRAVVLTKGDLRMVRQDDLVARDYLWKTYMLGGHADAALLARLEMEERLTDILIDDTPPGYGFQRGAREPSLTLQTLRPLKSRKVRWYGPLRDEWFEDIPTGTKREPDERLYRGQRLLVTTGAKEGYGPYVRLETAPFSFRHTIYCIPLTTLSEQQALVVLGIVWSSLARYRLFLTSGTLAHWYDKMLANDFLSLPVRLPDRGGRLEERIVRAVQAIRTWEPAQPSLFGGTDLDEVGPPRRLIDALDSAIFDLFELEDYERDLVVDFVRYGLGMISGGASAEAFAPLLPDGLWGWTGKGYRPPTTFYSSQLMSYVTAFLDWWAPHLVPDGGLTWHIVQPKSIPMIAVFFSTREEGALSPQTGSMGWEGVLEACSAALRQPVAERLYVDAVLRAVTLTTIIIVKRDEQRLWTRSMAREDAEATYLRAMLANEAGGAVTAR